MEIAQLYQLFLQTSGVTTDTRNLKEKGMFFALKGANFNGNNFALMALESGCAYAVVDEFQELEDERIIVVDDVLLTLQKLANYHRRQFNIPVIGITGSNGKTTSKELAGTVLKKKFNTLVTEGNLNNHLGVPFTLLRLTAEHQMAIIEMGANKPGDIKELVEIAEPTHGIITNIGAAHIEGFGSLTGVIKTKGEMYDFIAVNAGEIFVNAEDETLKGILPKNVLKHTFGVEVGDVRGVMLDQNPFVRFTWSYGAYQSPDLHTNLVGRYNFTNFLLAISLGVHFGVDNDLINQAIESYLPSNNRSQVTKSNRNTLIVDCYNANATSMKAALQSFVEMSGSNKWVILGDMLELGDISDVEHEKIIHFLEINKLNALLVGNEMGKITTHYKQYATWQDLVADEALNQISDAIVLLKGSRGIRLEELIAHL